MADTRTPTTALEDGNSFADTTEFEFVRLIAEGGMGGVYEAVQRGAQGFRKRVAIKLIRSGSESNERYRLRFVSEAKLVASLVHENIVQIYQLGYQDDHYYIVMEYINGCDLVKFWKLHRRLEHRMPVEIGAFIASRMCRALDYAHRSTDDEGQPMGLVHRDISLPNIMITNEGVPKLADFGIALTDRLDDPYEKPGDVVGKPGYLSPEQMQGHEVDNRSDLFSLGTVLWELLSLEHLFLRRKLSDMRKALLDEPIPSLQTVRSDVPDAVDAILTKALARDPEARFQNAGEMGAALEVFLFGDGYGPTNETLGTYLADLLQQPVG